MMKNREFKQPVFHGDFNKKIAMKQKVAGRLSFLYVDFYSVACH